MSNERDVSDRQQSLAVRTGARSLNKPDPALDGWWVKEAQRRSKAYRKGAVRGYSVEKVFGKPL